MQCSEKQEGLHFTLLLASHQHCILDLRVVPELLHCRSDRLTSHKSISGCRSGGKGSRKTPKYAFIRGSGDLEVFYRAVRPIFSQSYALVPANPPPKQKIVHAEQHFHSVGVLPKKYSVVLHPVTGTALERAPSRFQTSKRPKANTARFSWW